MNKSSKNNETFFSLSDDLTKKPESNGLTEIRKAICKSVRQITKLQEAITLQEKKVFKYLAQEKQILVRKN